MNIDRRELIAGFLAAIAAGTVPVAAYEFVTIDGTVRAVPASYKFDYARVVAGMRDALSKSYGQHFVPWDDSSLVDCFVQALHDHNASLGRIEHVREDVALQARGAFPQTAFSWSKEELSS